MTERRHHDRELRFESLCPAGILHLVASNFIFCDEIRPFARSDKQ